jgi:RNA polymerase sigma-70 factor, ECF subfamily
MSGARIAPTDRDLDHAALLEAVAAGDQAAFRRLYDASASLLFGVALRLMRDKEAARDVLQEAVVRIWQKAHLFDRTKGNALGWMVVVTRNCALSRLAVAAPPLASLDDETVRASVEAKSIEAKSVDDPSLTVDLHRCLNQLNEKYRTCVTLVYLFGLSYQELADRMSVPLGTAKTWIHRAMGELAACLEQ